MVGGATNEDHECTMSWVMVVARAAAGPAGQLLMKRFPKDGVT